jgi:hypothetical protein
MPKKATGRNRNKTAGLRAKLHAKTAKRNARKAGLLRKRSANGRLRR